uniref:Acylphosphatase n=1 Tax=Denticeps clupeoides TaxID=299321 RepID=A0AAY4AY16_9TELE
MRKARPVCMPSRSVSARSPAAARLSPVALLLVLLAMSADADGAKVASVDFEIFGDVQGVCFRMYTEDEGRKLGLSGWVKNTRQGTVVGQVQGSPEKVREITTPADMDYDDIIFRGLSGSGRSNGLQLSVRSVQGANCRIDP